MVQQRLNAWRLETDLEEKDRLMAELFALLSDENAAEIFQSLSNEDSTGRFGITALQRWLAVDPVQAANWLAARPEASAEQATLVAQALLPNRDAFQNYLDRLQDGYWKQQVLGAAGFAIASTEPVQAVALATRMNPGEVQTALLQSSVFEWARRDPTAVMKWTEQVEEPDLRESLTAWAAKGLAESDPRKAVEWLVSKVSADELLSDAGQSIVRSWAASEPAAAADWVFHFDEGRVKDEALETVMSFWAASDLHGARAWTGQLPEGPFRRDASIILARTEPYL